MTIKMKMRAIGVRKGKREPEIFEMEAPKIKKKDDILLEMIGVGVCLTDKDILENSLVDSPPNDDKLILGHEALARVVEIGSEVKSVKKGDYVVMIPRHSCGICKPCKTGRSDFCETGNYTAAGQHKLHGYFSELYVEQEAYVVKVPAEISDVAVLTEPFSITEKAITQAEYIQRRIPSFEFNKSKAVVFGMGAVGMTAIAILRNRGIETYVLGRRDENDPKVKLARDFGAKYIDIRGNNVMTIKKQIGTADIVIEATGATQLVIDLIELMARNGIYIFLGIPKGAEELCFNIKRMINRIVRENLVIIGSVNSQREHFEAALKNMAEIQKKNKGIINRIITDVYTLDKYKEAFSKERDSHIKTVIEFKKLR